MCRLHVPDRADGALVDIEAFNTTDMLLATDDEGLRGGYRPGSSILYVNLVSVYDPTGAPQVRPLRPELPAQASWDLMTPAPRAIRP